MSFPDGTSTTLLMAVLVPFLVLAAVVVVLAAVESLWDAGAAGESEPAPRELPAERPYDDDLPKAA
jgi:hypothetical protein